MKPVKVLMLLSTTILFAAPAALVSASDVNLLGDPRKDLVASESVRETGPSQNTPAAPESQTYMLLASLGLMGFVIRRRKRQY